MKIFNWTREDGTPTREWCRDDTHGTHVPLPLDVDAVSDAVVQSLLHALENETGERLPDADGYDLAVARAAIAALAAALGEEG
jgi:hypothetical protein